MDILSSLRHNFLILGFTGPLRSGCTTAAKFFYSGKINKAIGQLINSDNCLQTKIEKLYQELHFLKPTTSSTRKEKLQNINDKSIMLKELLKKREILKVMKQHESNSQQFESISMTDMIFKIIIENNEHKNEPIGTTNSNKIKFIKNLQDIIQNRFSEELLSKVQNMNKNIKDRNLNNLDDEQCEIYNQYLNNISILCEKIKKGTKSFRIDFIAEMLQDFGDNLRRCGCAFNYDDTNRNPENIFILAEEANHMIKYLSAKQKKKLSTSVRQFAIEAFRNPYEVEYFRNRYYEFYLVSLYANLENRLKRSDFSKEREKRDKGEGIKAESLHTQNVAECVRLSDIAITTDGPKKELYEKLLKYFALIKQPGCFAPEWEETAMHMAYSMSVRSTCISRQVGAVIEGANGYIVGAGWNDVGKGQLGCGYRCYRDFFELQPEILPCYREGDESFRNDWLPDKIKKGGNSDLNAFCFKDEYSQFEINKKIDKALEKAKPISDPRKVKNVTDNIREELSKTKRLEFCRALHAEENAILQTAIIGGIGIRNGIIYTTTFPCELCAKKIYQSGIKKVVYTEPYPESLSHDVFFQDGLRTIELVQFEGVKSHSYYRLFKSTINKKEMIELNQLGRD